MSQQTIKQRARQQALDVKARQRRERADREKRISNLAESVMRAVWERDAFVVESERRAGAALRALIEVEGLTLREALTWCGEAVTVREANRLRALPAPETAERTDNKTTPKTASEAAPSAEGNTDRRAPASAPGQGE